MVLNYGIAWRKTRGGIEDAVELGRENTRQGSLELDTVWYLRGKTLRQNVLFYDGEDFYLKDREVCLDPQVEAFRHNLKHFLFSFGVCQIADSFFSEASFHEDFIRFFPSSFACGAFVAFILYEKASRMSLLTWRLYKEITSAGL